jgi:hypothetical protein
MEILGDKFLDFFGIALDGLSEGRIIKGTEFGYDAADHSG